MGCEDGCVEKSSCVRKLLNPSMDLRSELRLMGRWGRDREGEEKQEGVVTLGMTPRALAWVTERTALFLIVNTKDDVVCRRENAFRCGYVNDTGNQGNIQGLAFYGQLHRLVVLEFKTEAELEIQVCKSPVYLELLLRL